MKPNLLRVELRPGNGPGVIFAADGKNYYTYQEANKRYTKDALPASPTEFQGQWEGEIDAFFGDEHYQEIVMVRDIPFQTFCEHHMLPFLGKAHVAYIPKGRVTGLSKLARLLEGYCRRLQMQERLTSQVADALMDRLDAMGVLVVLEAEHLCMTMRGVKKPGSVTVTSAVRGTMANNPSTRAEALALIDRGR